MTACLCSALLSSVAVQAEPYHLVAGSSALGFRENDKQNVSLGFKSAFNALLSTENIQCDFKTYDTSDELGLAIAKGQVNAFFGSPLEFLKSEEYLVAGIVSGAVFSQKLKSKTYLIVRKDSGINNLLQLRNKKLSMQKYLVSDVGGLYIETLMLEHQLPETKRFFSEIKYTDTSNTAIIDLFFKKVDATLMSEIQFDIATELNPQLLKQTKIIETSEPYLIFVAALTKGTPEVTASSIRASLFSVDQTRKGRNVLNLMKMQGFREISTSELDNVRALVEKNKQLRVQASDQ